MNDVRTNDICSLNMEYKYCVGFCNFEQYVILTQLHQSISVKWWYIDIRILPLIHTGVQYILCSVIYMLLYLRTCYVSGCLRVFVVNAKALSIMHYQDGINTEHNMKSMCRAAVAQWTKAPDLQWINANSKLERRKYSFIIYKILTLCIIYYILFTVTGHVPRKIAICHF